MTKAGKRLITAAREAALLAKIEALEAENARLREALDPINCPHPARKGAHEVYGRPDGSSFCRACGAEFDPPKARAEKE